MGAIHFTIAQRNFPYCTKFMSCNMHVQGQWEQYKNMAAFVAVDLSGQAIILSNSLKS